MLQFRGLRGLRTQPRAVRAWQHYQRPQQSRLLSVHTRLRASCSASDAQSQHLTHSSHILLSPYRSLHTSIALRNPASSGSTPEPAALSNEAYHEYADTYLETLLNKLEEIAETKLDVDVEYSAGVLNCVFPPHGTYVLNKQPPNKQIWLSSPVSGPKRYDYVLPDGVPEAAGEWVYLRDGSRLSDLLREELGVEVVAGAEEVN